MRIKRKEPSELAVQSSETSITELSDFIKSLNASNPEDEALREQLRSEIAKRYEYMWGKLQVGIDLGSPDHFEAGIKLLTGLTDLYGLKLPAKKEVRTEVKTEIKLDWS
jgi:hypothetical protein